MKGEESLERSLTRRGAAGILAQDAVVDLERLSVLTLLAECIGAQEKDLRPAVGVVGEGGCRIPDHGIIIPRSGC